MFFSWRERGNWQPLLDATKGRRPSAAEVHRLLEAIYPGGVIAYHGCRPESVDSYYRDGVQSANVRRIDDEARKLFVSPAFPGLTQTAVNGAIAQLETRFDHLVNVIIDDRVLLQSAGHYLIYGSERIQSIAVRLPINARQALKQIGRPTIFEIGLPWDALTDRTMDGLISTLRSHLHIIRRHKVVPLLDFTVNVLHVPPAWIRTHEHPAEIVDMHEGMSIYRAPVPL